RYWLRWAHQRCLQHLRRRRYAQHAHEHALRGLRPCTGFSRYAAPVTGSLERATASRRKLWRFLHSRWPGEFTRTGGRFCAGKRPRRGLPFTERFLKGARLACHSSPFVILSAAKNLSPGTEILRCAQNDSSLAPFLKNLLAKGGTC